MTTEDYVSYPVALALKKAGFDWECDKWIASKSFSYYDEDECCDHNAVIRKGWLISQKQKERYDQEALPYLTLWQAQKWLREVHSLHVDISTHGKNYWTTSITGFNNEDIPVGYLHPVNAQAFDNYESALSAGIAAALELIEKKGE